MLQKKIIRAITFSDFNGHTAPLFKELGILKLKGNYEYKIVTLMWDLDHGMLPNSLASLFTWCKEVHTRNLRNTDKNKLYPAKCCKHRCGYD